MRILLLALAACGSNDPTFMKVCEIGGQFEYPLPGKTEALSCASPFEIVWPAMPLKVAIAVDPETDVYHDSITQAIGYWNGEIDHTVLVTVRTGEEPDVTVSFGSVGGVELGVAYHQHDAAGKLKGFVEIRRPGDITEVYFTVAHEYGHILGLAHDDCCDRSIMYPYLDVGLIDNTSGEDFPILLVTEADHDAIVERYF